MTKIRILFLEIATLLLACLPLAAWAKSPQESQNPAAPPAPESSKTKNPAALSEPSAGKPTNPVQLGQPAADGAAAADKVYVIGAEDVLRIQVWGELRLSGDFIVRPDGRISMNLINEVQAAGKTCQELGNTIAERLKAGEFMKNPSVNVQVIEVRSKKYYINGEVNKPGQYYLVMPTTVLEALNNAGGFKDFANKKKIKILRTTPEGLKEFPFDYNSVIKGKKLEENIFLKPGDQIIVP